MINNFILFPYILIVETGVRKIEKKSEVSDREGLEGQFSDLSVGETGRGLWNFTSNEVVYNFTLKLKF